jgi:hypothetical protein
MAGVNWRTLRLLRNQDSMNKNCPSEDLNSNLDGPTLRTIITETDATYFHHIKDQR